MSEANGEARVASKVNKTRPKLLQSVAEARVGKGVNSLAER